MEIQTNLRNWTLGNLLEFSVVYIRVADETRWDEIYHISSRRIVW